MTLLDLLTLISFTTPLVLGVLAGAAAGVVGIMIGMGTGLVAGGLAYYALKKTAKYSGELRGKFQTQVVKTLIDSVTAVWLLFLLVAAASMTIFSTKFIVQQMAG